MKVFKFISAFLLAATIIFVIIIGFNQTAFKAVFSDRAAFSEGSEWIERTYSLSGLVEFMEANPEYISVVSLNVHNMDDSILFNENEPRPLGALGNMFLIMEYARQIQEGLISEDDRVSVDEINRFIVPGWYEAANRNAFRNVESIDGTIAMHQVVSLVSRHYSQAASDWLLFSLGVEKVNALVDSLGNGRIEPLIPGSGIQIAVILRENDLGNEDMVRFYKERSVEERTKLFTEYAQRYVEDDLFRKQVMEKAPGISERLLSDERLIHSLWNRAEPLAYTRIMAQIFNDEFLDEASSQLIKTYLTAAGEDPVVRQHTTYYGAIFESRLGYLAALDMGTSVYTEKSYIQTVFFSDLPIAFWLHMSSNFMNHEYQRRLIYDPEMRRITDLASRQELTDEAINP